MDCPIGVSLKKYRHKQIAVKQLITDIHRWSGKKLPTCTKNYSFAELSPTLRKKILWFLFPAACCISKSWFPKYFWYY